MHGDLTPVPGGLVVLLDEEGTGTEELLRAYGEGVLLPAPPGQDWQPHDVVADLAPADLLATLGYTAPLEREMWMLSGGERQRVRLARALTCEGTLLLHEPFGYLDTAGVRTVLAVLRGRTAVVLTVDARAEPSADRVLVVRDGTVVPA